MRADLTKSQFGPAKYRSDAVPRWQTEGDTSATLFNADLLATMGIMAAFGFYAGWRIWG